MYEEHKYRQLSLQWFYFHVRNIESMTAKFTDYVKSHICYLKISLGVASDITSYFSNCLGGFSYFFSVQIVHVYYSVKIGTSDDANLCFKVCCFVKQNFYLVKINRLSCFLNCLILNNSDLEK